MTTPIQTIYPAVRYRDPDAAIEWLGRAFGCTEKVVYRDEHGSVHHAELAFDEHNLIMLGGVREHALPDGSSPGPPACPISLYLVVADPDAHHERAQAAGARIVRELTDMDYGSREYSARDPEGNVWSFGTYQPQTAT